MNDCLHHATCEYARPFFVGSHANFCGAWSGYLPPLCDPAHCDRYKVEPLPQVVEHRHIQSSMGKQDYDLLQQTARKVTYVDEKLSEHIATPKKSRGKY